jgi:hypothetical protein
MSVQWSSSFDAYASDQITVAQIQCLLCKKAPCDCATTAPFGSDLYFHRTRRLHSMPCPPSCSACEEKLS